MSPSAEESRAKTIVKPASLSGIGLHSGESCTIKFMPFHGKGIFFVHKGKRIPVLAEYVTGTDRGTTLGEVQTVEHVLSAVNGLGIDALEIELSANEPPIMDGSSAPFAEALLHAGFFEIARRKKVFSVTEHLCLQENDATLEVFPYNGFAVHFMVDFPVIGPQEFVFEGDYLSQVARARTFGYLDEVESLKKRGLAVGATLLNALVIGREGFVNTPRYADEPVRHKILDLIGDLALVGAEVRGKIVAKKSGHKLNVALAKKLREGFLKGEY